MGERTDILRIPRESNWLGNFRIEYDGKYIGLMGKDKNYPCWFVPDDQPAEYEEMCFGGSFAEGRNLSPEITEVTDKYIYINIGDMRESLAWTKMVDDVDRKVFEPTDY